MSAAASTTTTTKYRTSPHRGAAAPAPSAGLLALEVVIRSTSFYGTYGDFANLAGTCRALRNDVCLLRKSEAARVIRMLSEAPDFEAGYGPALRKLEPLISCDDYAELKALLLPFSSDDFYVWAMIGLACMERTCKLALFTPMQFGFTDTLFPLIGDGDTGEPDGAIASFLEETELLSYATKEQRECMEWALWPASFAAQYNDSRGAVPPFFRLLDQLVESTRA
jgi:hypothetical protein